LGTLNAVEFSCLDLDLVRGAPDCRRQWLDTLLTQLEPLYAHILGQYQHILKQRNALLKTFRQQTEMGESPQVEQQNNLALWDQQLVEMGTRVARRRSRGIERLAPLAGEWHRRISGEKEQLQITYQPSIVWEGDDPQVVQQAFFERLAQRRSAEYQLGATVVGPHRDEIQFSINGAPAKTYGSQGQQRTLVLALKLAELSLIEAVIGEPPLLLLDDVLAELDLDRQSQLLAAVEDRFQTLITTTHLNRFDDQWRRSAQIFRVNNGYLEQLWLSEID
jgi:DNA replication and repair protein RecF